MVYAGPGPSPLTLFNLNMPGVPGLDGGRTFTGAGGAVTPASGLGDGGTDEITFTARAARHVRFLGRSAAGVYGYSLFAFEALDAAGTDRARGRPVTASSVDPAYPAANAVDGDTGTRWAVSREDAAVPTAGSPSTSAPPHPAHRRPVALGGRVRHLVRHPDLDRRHHLDDRGHRARNGDAGRLGDIDGRAGRRARAPPARSPVVGEG